MSWNRFVFTITPKGLLCKLQTNENLAQGQVLKRHAVLVALCKSWLQAHTVCWDGCSSQHIAETHRQLSLTYVHIKFHNYCKCCSSHCMLGYRPMLRYCRNWAGNFYTLYDLSTPLVPWTGPHIPGCASHLIYDSWNPVRGMQSW